MSGRDCVAFDVFHLPRTFSLDKKKLRNDYLRFQRQFHPDVCPGTEQRIERINAAYKVLMDDVRRANALFDGKCAPSTHLEEQLAFGERKQELLEKGDPDAFETLNRELKEKLKTLTDNFAEAYTKGNLSQAQKFLGDMNFYKQ